MKKTILRSAVSGVAILGALGIGGASQAADTTLNIIRDGRGGVIQSIPVESWSYDRKKNLITVQSQEGDRVCAGAPSEGSWSGAYMQLDGNYYRVESMSLPTRRSGTLSITPVRDGVFPLCASTRQPVQSYQSVAKGVTGGLGLELDMVDAGRLVRREVPVDGSISLMPGAVPQIVADLSQAVLCLQSPGTPSGGQLQLTDTNGQSLTWSGVDPLEYRFADRVLSLETTSSLTCFSVPTLPEIPLSKGSTLPCSESDQLFNTSFEIPQNEPLPLEAPLQTALRVEQAPAINTSEPLVYDFVVRNCSESRSLSNVRIRGFFPGPQSGSVATLEQMPTAVDCGGSVSNCVNAAGYMNFTIPSLAPGGQHVTRVTRQLLTGTVSDHLNVTAVAAASLGEKAVPEHSIKSWDVMVVDTNNESPTLTVTSGILPTTAAPFTLDEDASGVPVTGFTLTAVDVDSGFSCSGGSCVVVSSSNGNVLPAGAVSASFNAGVVTLSLSPLANAFGDATLSVSVTDSAGATSNSVSIPVRVSAVNDPPTFEIGNGFDETASAKILTPSPQPYCTLVQTAANGAFALASASCPSHKWPSGLSGLDSVLDYNGWIANRSAGPGESGAVTLQLSKDDPNGVLTSLKFDANTGDLEYQGTGAKGSATLTVTATDPEGASTSIDIIVDVANSSPVIDSNGGGDTASIPVNENQTDVTVVNATDADDDASAISYGISGGADAGHFSIDGVSGVLAFVSAPDFESPADSNGDNAYDVVVTASDGSGGIDSQTITVSVQNVNEAPVIAAGQVFTIDENSPQDALVGVVAASDPEGDAITTWRIVSGNLDVNNNGFKAFVRDNAQIDVLDSGDLDFETTPQFILTLEASDGVNTSAQETVTVNLNDVAE